MGAFQARFEGRCDDCREPIARGEWIVSKGDGRGYAHEVCPDTPDSRLDLAPGEVVCPTCWLVKPCDCPEVA
jgi:hypothetical protein